MTIQIENLTGNVGKFAHYCAEQCSVADLVDFARNGIDVEMCEKWGITGEQWQDAIFAAMAVLRKKN
ncbi:MAG: hypothetical protein RBR22_04545 [Desulfuromonas sp.]|nr:hypothetical protein [Desulfuromonas sp.]